MIKYSLLRNLLGFLLCCSASATVIAQNGLHFDGADDVVDCGDAATVQLSGTAITLEAWIYPTSFKTNFWEGNIINKETWVPQAGYMLRCGAGGKLNFNLGDGLWNELTTAAPVLATNTWQHVAGSYDGTKMRLYVDGMQVDSLSGPAFFNNAVQFLAIGNDFTSGFVRGFDGKIDEVRIWNVHRTSAEIYNNWNKELCDLPTSLVAYYRADEGVAGGNNVGKTALPDLTLNANDGTLMTFALTGAVSNWDSGASLSSGVDVSVTQNTNTLMANASSLSYQWLQCGAGNVFTNIVGETSQTYVALTDGDYAVEVSEGICSDTSSCYSVSFASLKEQESNSRFEVFPNPTSEKLFVNSKNSKAGSTEIGFFSLHGQQLLNACSAKSTTTLDVSGMKSGVYLLLIQSDGKMQQELVVIQ